MKRFSGFGFGPLLLLSALRGFGQAPVQTDSPVLQSILAEMRSIHNDVRLGSTTQILLAEFEVQQAAVTRAQQKRDDANRGLTQIQETRKMLGTEIANIDVTIDPTAPPTEAQKRQMEQMQKQIKLQLTNLDTQEQNRTNELQDAEAALRREKETLAGIQGQLDAVVKKLQPAGN